MSAAKLSRHKKAKLEPIDWREMASDAVLNGNMSTLFHRPANEDVSRYASEEAQVEIRRRASLPGPTVGTEPAVGRAATEESIPTVGSAPPIVKDVPDAVTDRDPETVPSVPTVGTAPTVDCHSYTAPTVSFRPTVTTNTQAVSVTPTVGLPPPATDPPPYLQQPSFFPPTVVYRPTVGPRKKVKPIRDVQDALTLAGQILYRAMYGAPDGAPSKTCVKGYRQLAAETHLDKDTVRDLIADFKLKGMVRETGTYDPDTRSSKTYDVLSYRSILQLWRDRGLHFVITGRRPTFCDPAGEPIILTPTVGPLPTLGQEHSAPTIPTVGSAPTGNPRGAKPTAGPIPAEPLPSTPTDPLGPRPTPLEKPAATTQQPTTSDAVPPAVVAALAENFGLVDDDAVRRITASCRARVPDATADEIAVFARSTAQRIRGMKNLSNPVGLLITQVPKCFEGESFRQFREAEDKRRLASQAENERLRREQQSILDDPQAPPEDREWARQILESLNS